MSKIEAWVRGRGRVGTVVVGVRFSGSVGGVLVLCARWVCHVCEPRVRTNQFVQVRVRWDTRKRSDNAPPENKSQSSEAAEIARTRGLVFYLIVAYSELFVRCAHI